MEIRLGDIRSNFKSFKELSELAVKLEGITFEEIELDMGGVKWFDANICAPFGAILYKTRRFGNKVKLKNISNKVEKILTKNGFLASYGYEKIPDTFGTTIPYTRLEVNDERYFVDYVSRSLRKGNMPDMSPAVRKKLLESIFEIFNNAVFHSKTEYGIFTCGQFFPKRDRLDFCITDLGIGIKENLAQKRNIHLSAEEAIEWVLSEGNTTRDGSKPGGLGLKLLREFISMNKGRIQIMSDSGYWELKEGDVAKYKKLPSPFPGTVVNLEFNTADKFSCYLVSELPPDSIF